MFPWFLIIKVPLSPPVDSDVADKVCCVDNVPEVISKGLVKKAPNCSLTSFAVIVSAINVPPSPLHRKLD